jgi:hypothetical protein
LIHRAAVHTLPMLFNGRIAFEEYTIADAAVRPSAALSQWRMH